MENGRILRNSQIIILGLCIAAATIFSSLILSQGFMKVMKFNKEVIAVTGSAQQLIRSDLIVWQTEFAQRDTVIMRDLSIHIVDPRGDGEHLKREANNNLHARECINLAGDDGQKIIEEAGNDDHLMLAAYRIIQRDILKALKERKEATE